MLQITRSPEVVDADIQPYVSIVIPANNEEENIPQLYEELKRSLEPVNRAYEKIFVDDASEDRTYGVSEDLSEMDRHLKVIRFRSNSGQSAALSAGFGIASGSYIIMDDIHDYRCTLRAYRKECIKDMELYGEMHRYIPATARFNKHSVSDMEINHRERKYGRIKHNWKRLFKGFSDLLVVTFWCGFAHRPMDIYGTTGLFLGGVGLLVSAYMVAERLLFNSGLPDSLLFITALITMTIGLRFITLRIYYRQKGFKNYWIGSTLNVKEQ